MASKRKRKPTLRDLRRAEWEWWNMRTLYSYKLQAIREGKERAQPKYVTAAVLLSLKTELSDEEYRETDEGRVEWARLEKARDDFLGEIALYLGADAQPSHDARNRELALLLAAQVFPTGRPVGRPKRGIETRGSQPMHGAFLLLDYRKRRSGRPGMDDFAVELVASLMPTAKTLLEEQRGRTVTQAETIALIRSRLGETGLNAPSERTVQNRLALLRKKVARNLS